MSAQGILDTIIGEKVKELESQKKLYPSALLEQSPYFSTPVCSLKEYLLRGDLSGVIAEIKRASPSKGVFHKTLDIAQVSLGYMQAGASALSILTEKKHFGGSLEDLKIARKNNYCPILRKDFLIDEYQILEARSAGADVVLLICACLDSQQLARLASFAKSIGLEVLLEIHSEKELQLVSNWDDVDVLGVNNRDLQTFQVDIYQSERLFEKLPPGKVCISESGIHTLEDMKYLWGLGYRGFLMGERFLQHADPVLACRQALEPWIREKQKLCAAS